MIAERALDFLGIDGFAVVQAAEQGRDNLFGFLFAEVLDETIEKMLSGEGVIDLAFFIVILQLGKVDDPVLPRILGLAVDFEHHLIGLKQHSFEIITGGMAGNAKGRGDGREHPRWRGSGSGRCEGAPGVLVGHTRMLEWGGIGRE